MTPKRIALVSPLVVWAPRAMLVAVHVYGGGQLTTMPGRVEVVDNPEHPWASKTCGVVVMGGCIEP